MVSASKEQITELRKLKVLLYVEGAKRNARLIAFEVKKYADSLSRT